MKKQTKASEKKVQPVRDTILEAVKNRQKLELEIGLGKSQDTGKLREIRRSIARLLTETNKKQKTESKSL